MMHKAEVLGAVHAGKLRAGEEFGKQTGKRSRFCQFCFDGVSGLDGVVEQPTPLIPALGRQEERDI